MISLYIRIAFGVLIVSSLDATLTRSGGGKVYSPQQLRQRRKARLERERAMRDAASQQPVQQRTQREARTVVCDSDSDSDITCNRKTCCCLWILSHCCR